MKLFLDTVSGHAANIGIGVGRVSRMALVTDIPVPLMKVALPGGGAAGTPGALLMAITALGLPTLKSTYPWPGYEEYFLKQIIPRALGATQAGIEMIYEFRGLLTIQDTSTLSMVPTQVHPSDHKPLWIKWDFGGGKIYKRLATMQTPLPLRHIIASQTVPQVASINVLTAFGAVNQTTWQGLPKGYWLYSGLDGFTQDDGTTYTYTCTMTTKQKENWLQLAFLEGDDGQVVSDIDDGGAKALRDMDYFYGQTDTPSSGGAVNGVLVAGMYPMVDFNTLFGF